VNSDFYNGLDSDDRSVFRLLLAFVEFNIFDLESLNNVRASSTRYIMIGAYFDTDILLNNVHLYDSKKTTVEVAVCIVDHNKKYTLSKVDVHREEYAFDTFMSIVAPYYFDDIVNGDSIDYRLTTSQSTEVFNNMFMPMNTPTIVTADAKSLDSVWCPNFHGFELYEAMDTLTRRGITSITWQDVFDMAKVEEGLRINFRIPPKVHFLSLLLQMLILFCGIIVFRHI
jgi:hypothetical protein